MKARLMRYAPIQLMDYVIERGLVTLAMGALFGWMGVIGNGQRSPDWAQGERGLQVIQLFFISMFGLFTWFGTLTAVNGIISNDRVKGTFRFLFSKPVNVLRYYAQSWVLNGIGLLLVVCVLMALFSIAVRPFFPPMILLYVLVTYVMLGGAGFLFSAITRRDGIALVVFWLMAFVFRLKYSGESGLVARLVKVVTPPADEMSPFIEAVMRSAPVNMSTVWSALAYGAVCFAAGLVVLRYRSMTT